MKIEYSASCEIRPVIKFLIAKNIRPAEMHGQVWKFMGKML
jgi:hypothetical protein